MFFPEDLEIQLHDYLREHVEPKLVEFDAEKTSKRRANDAVQVVDQLAPRIFNWCKDNNPSLVAGIKGDIEFRSQLAQANSEFELVRDMAKAEKHMRLDRGSPLVSSSTQIQAKTRGWGEGPYGEGPYGGREQIVVDLNDGSSRNVYTVVCAAYRFLQNHMSGIGAT